MLVQLRSLRLAAGLSQRQIANSLTVPHSWVAKVESGERRLDLIEFGWFCEACGASAAEQAGILLRNQRGAAKPRRGGGK